MVPFLSEYVKASAVGVTYTLKKIKVCHKGYSFVFHQAVFKKVASAGLNSLRQKGYQILVKNWVFDDPFNKKGQILVILVPGMIQPSGSVNFLMK